MESCTLEDKIVTILLIKKRFWAQNSRFKWLQTANQLLETQVQQELRIRHKT